MRKRSGLHVKESAASMLPRLPEKVSTDELARDQEKIAFKIKMSGTLVPYLEFAVRTPRVTKD